MTGRTTPELPRDVGYALEVLNRGDCVSALDTAGGQVNNRVLWRLLRAGWAERHATVDGRGRYRLTAAGRGRLGVRR